MIDPSNKAFVRVHHALRCAIGGAIVGVVGLAFPLFNVCLANILFFISTVAGTPQNYQGFQLRSTSLTFTGAILGILSYALIVAIANTSRVAMFFAMLPFITFFSGLRVDPALLPLPVVANVVLGLLLISTLDDGRAHLPDHLLRFFTGAAVAWASANVVNFFFPCRASDVGRKLMRDELRRIGSVISNIVATAFSRPSNSILCSANQGPGSSSSTSPMFPPASRLPQAPHIALFLPGESLPKDPDNSPFSSRDASDKMELIDNTLHSTYESLQYLRHLPPFGSTRQSDYSNLSESRVLLESSAYEPRLLPESASHWRNVSAWRDVASAVKALIHKVSCLESVVLLYCGTHEHLDYSRLANFLGHAYVPLWISHLASCATSCARMSQIMCEASCSNLKPNTCDMTMRDDLDPAHWRSRRAEMYFGFLLHHRLSARNESPIINHLHISELRNLEPPIVKSLDLQYNLMKGRITPLGDNNKDEKPMLNAEILDLANRRALSFFAIASHALAEEIGHVRHSLVRLGASGNVRGWFAPFHFVVSAFPVLAQRIRIMVLARMHAWEVRFMSTHALLLSCILALALFLPPNIFKRNETAWTYGSAALVAQLSAEPTLFIALWRVLATVAGSAMGFGFASILRTIDNDNAVYYLIVPYMFLITIACLLLVPPTYRYAAFLIIITNGVMLFCPRTTNECLNAEREVDEACLADISYAISRTASVTVGVVFAIIFHILFWPRYANDDALRKLSRAFKNSTQVLHKLRLRYFSFGLDNRGKNTNESRSEHDLVLSSSDGLSTTDLNMEGDLYSGDLSLLQDVQREVGKYVSIAVQTAKSEASVFHTGPLGMHPLLSRLIPDFIALEVTLSEMAALLGRTPIFSRSYGRVVFGEIIQPMMMQYETIHISLKNLVFTANETSVPERRRLIPENVAELCQAVKHLAKCRSELRRVTHKRRKTLDKLSVIDVDVRQRLCHWQGNIGRDADKLWHEGLNKRRTPLTDFDIGQRHEQKLHLDDIVMYDTFTFIAEGCLSAFLRIALTILEEAKNELESRSRKSKNE